MFGVDAYICKLAYIAHRTLWLDSKMSFGFVSNIKFDIR